MPDTSDKMARRLERVRGLPSLPEVLSLLEQVLADEMASASDVAEVLRDDPAVTTRLLAIANSALYAGRHSRNCDSVGEAVARIGFSQVRQICLSLSVVNMFPSEGSSLDHKAFWRHSLFVANAARLLAERSPTKNLVGDNAHFTSGLLHDIGELVLDQFFHEDFVRARALAKLQQIPVSQAERQVLDADHSLVGKEIALMWRLPENTASGICYHENPESAPEVHRDLARRIYVADVFSETHDMGNVGNEVEAQLDPGVVDALGLTVGEINDVLEGAISATEQSTLASEIQCI